MVGQWVPLVCIGDECEFFKTFTMDCIVSNFVSKTNATNLTFTVRWSSRSHRILQVHQTNCTAVQTTIVTYLVNILPGCIVYKIECSV